jgi:hypothetical protein
MHLKNHYSHTQATYRHRKHKYNPHTRKVSNYTKMINMGIYSGLLLALWNTELGYRQIL